MFKPTELGVAGHEMTIDAYHRSLKRSIKKFQARQKRVYNTLIEIIDVEQNGQEIVVAGVNPSVITEINKYFAENMGPILLTRFNLLPNVQFNGNSICYFPISQINTVSDFMMKHNHKVYFFSSKVKKGSSNTLKPGDVVNKITKSKDLSEKWKNSKAFKTMQILSNESVVRGPIKAVRDNYRNTLPLSMTDYDSLLQQITSNDVIISRPTPGIKNLINRNPVTQQLYHQEKEITSMMVDFLFEKKLVEISQKDDEYNEIFHDVTGNSVYFIKFDLSRRADGMGKVSFSVNTPETTMKKAVFRSKNSAQGRRRSSGAINIDKLGLAVP